MTPEEIFAQYALTLCGVKYRWGGHSPLEGLDCSGLVRLLLKSQGIHLDISYTAQRLCNLFRDKKVETASLGALVFYGNSTWDIEHVAIALNKSQQIEAAGGDHTTILLTDAIEKDAYVRVTPIRHDLFQGFYLPQYPFFQK